MENQNVSTKVPGKGDVVWAMRLPMHCGICEGGNSIIHFAPPDSSKTKEEAIIHRSTLEEFANGSPYFVFDFPPEKCLPIDEIIERARSRIGEKNYNLLFNNCDHLATWCKIGEHSSQQIDFIKNSVVAMCKFLDKTNEKQTEYEKTADIICIIYRVIEALFSPEVKKT